MPELDRVWMLVDREGVVLYHRPGTSASEAWEYAVKDVKDITGWDASLLKKRGFRAKKSDYQFA